MTEKKRVTRLKGLSPLPEVRPAANGGSSAPPSSNGVDRTAASGGSSAPHGSNGVDRRAAPVAAPDLQPATDKAPVVVVQAPTPAATEDGGQWKRFLSAWPKGLKREGVIITSWDEQVPFSGFLTTDEMVMLERRNPDPQGARRVLMGFDAIKAVKITEVVNAAPFRDAGFDGPE